KWPMFLAILAGTCVFGVVVGYGAWFLLILPKRKAELAQRRQERELEPGNAIEYVARYGEADTRISERVFVRRGLQELWLLETLLGPLSAGFMLVIGYTAGARAGFFIMFGVLGAFLAISPAILLVVRPALAAAGARRTPTRVIAFRPEGLVLGEG